MIFALAGIPGFGDFANHLHERDADCTHELCPCPCLQLTDQAATACGSPHGNVESI